MNRRWWIVVAFGLLVALGTVALLRGRAAQVSAAPAELAAMRREAEVPDFAVASRPAADKASSPTRHELTPPGATSSPGVADRFLGGLRGRLLFEDARPAEAVSIEVLAFDPEELLATPLATSSVPGLQLARQSSTSDVDGRFGFRRLAARDTILLVAGRGTDFAKTIRVEVAAHAGSTQDLGDIVLARRPSLVGRVVGPDHLPVAGARVLAPPERDGRFRSWAAWLGDLRVDLFHPKALLLWRGADETLQVFTPPPWLDELVHALDLPYVETGADGRFRIPAVDGITSLTVGKPGLWPCHRTPIHAESGKDSDLGDLVLGVGNTVRGKVVTAAGAPVVGATLWLGPTAFRSDTRAALLDSGGTTAADGTFAISGQAQRPYYVAVRLPGTDEWLPSGPWPADQEITITLPRAVTLDVELARTAGAPPDVLLKVFRGRAQGEALTLSLLTPIRTTTAHAGDTCWHVTGLTPGIHTVLASAPGVPAQAVTIEVAGKTRVELVIPAPSELVVQVVDPTGAPLEGVLVTARPHEARAEDASVFPRTFPFAPWAAVPSARATSDARGVARLLGVPSDVLDVRARHPGFAPVTVSASLASGTVVVKLGGVGSIRGAVLQEGRALSKALTLEARPVEQATAIPPNPMRVQTAPDGTFAFEGIVPSIYEVTVVMPYDRTRSGNGLAVAFGTTANRVPSGERAMRTVEVVADRVAELFLELHPNCAAPNEPQFDVFGTVTVNGVPAAGRHIRVWQGDCYSSRPGPGKFPPLESEVAEDGSYRIRGLRQPTTTRTITLTLRSADDLILLAWNSNIVVPLAVPEFRYDLNVATGEVDGEVVDESGAPVSGTLSVMGGARITIDATGHFHLAEVPATAQTFQVFARSGITNVRNWKVAPGKNRLRITHYSFVRVAGTVDLRGIRAPGDLAITVVLIEVGGAFNYRPIAFVDKATGRFEVVGEPVMAGEYEIFVHSDGHWWREPGRVQVYPGKTDALRIMPVPCDGPAPAGPGLKAPAPPLREPEKGPDGRPVLRPKGAGSIQQGSPKK